MTRVGIVGAAGYIGGELLRLLLDHPEVEVGAAYSARLAGRRVDGTHPNLRGRTDLVFTDRARIGDDDLGCDVLFLATAHRAAAPIVAEHAGSGTCLIDLSADFRLRDPAAYRRHYEVAHPAPELLAAFVPGWPERYRGELRTADRISVPGCMATAALLALYPVAEAGLVEQDVTVDGRIGSSGSGATATTMNLHAERSGAMRVFAPHGHRHGAEVEQGTGLRVRMSATGVEAVRGAQVVCRAQLAEHARDHGEIAVRKALRQCYADEPFVRVVAYRRGLFRLPEPKILSGSNYCDVGFSLDPGTGELVLVAALDNLVKGGAGNAVQCLNIRMGWPERTGLGFAGLHPA